MKQEGPGRARGAGAGPWARSPLCLTWVGAPTVWQMVEYKRATLRDEDAPETPVEGGASPDAVEVGKGVLPVSLGPPALARRQAHPGALWVALERHLPPPQLHLWPLR